MKKWTFLFVFIAAVSFLAACKSNNNRQIGSERYAKKIYLTKEDYLEDLKQTAQRRELQPNKESEYIFNVTVEPESEYVFVSGL